MYYLPKPGSLVYNYDLYTVLVSESANFALPEKYASGCKWKEKCIILTTNEMLWILEILTF